MGLPWVPCSAGKCFWGDRGHRRGQSVLRTDERHLPGHIHASHTWPWSQASVPSPVQTHTFTKGGGVVILSSVSFLPWNVLNISRLPLCFISQCLVQLVKPNPYALKFLTANLWGWTLRLGHWMHFLEPRMPYQQNVPQWGCQLCALTEQSTYLTGDLFHQITEYSYYLHTDTEQLTFWCKEILAHILPMIFVKW